MGNPLDYIYRRVVLDAQCSLVTVAETFEYHNRSQKLLSVNEQEAVIGYLAAHPKSGNIMPGTGGLRKFRWSGGGKGKRGGVRVIYYYHNETQPLYLLAIYAKTKQADLSQAHRDELAKLVKALGSIWLGAADE